MERQRNNRNLGKQEYKSNKTLKVNKIHEKKV